MQKPAKTAMYYGICGAILWLAFLMSGPANGGPNGGMILAAGLVIVSLVITLVSVIRTFCGDKSTVGSTCIHLFVMFLIFAWWRSMR